VRHAVAQALGGRDDATALAALLGLMGDADPAVRGWATFAVASTDTDAKAVADALAARLDDAHPDARGEAMIGLARRGDTRCAPAIVRELAADDPMPLAVDAAELFVTACPSHAEVARALDRWRTANRRTLPWLEPPPRR
jgi:HEAT repeat protein